MGIPGHAGARGFGKACAALLHLRKQRSKQALRDRLLPDGAELLRQQLLKGERIQTGAGGRGGGGGLAQGLGIWGGGGSAV